ncbi:hypothetical protein OA78_2254 [Latilactobacillus curvatus]|nr:hypothetical protein OA78_2254 [Latilactobacillus curvatus]
MRWYFAPLIIVDLKGFRAHSFYQKNALKHIKGY